MTERIEGVGLRRATDLDPGAPLPAGDPGLVRRIQAEIRRDGRITFARFMEVALYDPEAGYYAGGRGATQTPAPATPDRGPGRSGDFLTAPEGHPIFGWAIARRLERLWADLGRPPRFVVREHGSGRGALAVGILDGLRRSGSELLRAVRYQAVEVSPVARFAFDRAVADAALADLVEPFDPRPEIGVVLANELLDALPVHRVEGGPNGSLLERFVVAAGDKSAARPESSVFREVTGPPSTPALAERLQAEGIRLGPGQVAEVCLALDGWVAEAAATLARGLLLVIDYGAPAAELYDPARGSTLRAYHRHRVHGDPFVAIGRQDLTAHVDLTALERAAARAGLRPGVSTTQGPYLADLGLGELLVSLQSGPAASLTAYLAARSAVVRMLDPRATGGFAVREFGR